MRVLSSVFDGNAMCFPIISFETQSIFLQEDFAVNFGHKDAAVSHNTTRILHCCGYLHGTAKCDARLSLPAYLKQQPDEAVNIFRCQRSATECPALEARCPVWAPTMTSTFLNETSNLRDGKRNTDRSASQHGAALHLNISRHWDVEMTTETRWERWSQNWSGGVNALAMANWILFHPLTVKSGQDLDAGKSQSVNRTYKAWRDVFVSTCLNSWTALRGYETISSSMPRHCQVASPLEMTTAIGTRGWTWPVPHGSEL
jgi:hypothetical protein